MLGLPRLFGTHTGENQAGVLQQVFALYGLDDATRVGFFMADNAESCDTTVRTILNRHYPSLSPGEKERLEQLRRCRCVGHILNLAASAFLRGEDPLEDTVDDTEVSVDVLRRWRQQGPVGKLHNLVRWVRSSPKRKDRFMEFSTGHVGRDTSLSDTTDAGAILDREEAPPGLVLVSDNKTRWNSTLAMILRALRLRRVVDVFCTVLQHERKEEDRVPVDDILSEQDWRVLVELVAVLQPLYRLTKRFEGNTYLRFHEVLPNLHQLRAQMQQLQDQYRRQTPSRAPRILDVIFVQVDSPVEDEEADIEPEPELLPVSNTRIPDRPRRRTRLPTRLDDYVVEMPGQRRPSTTSSIPLSGGSSIRVTTTSSSRTIPPPPPPIPAPNDSEMEDDEPEQLSYSGREVIQESIQLMMDKLEKYEDLLSDNTAVWAALAMDPRMKMRWVSKHLSSSRMDAIMLRIRDYFEDNYPSSIAPSQFAEPTSSSVTPENMSLPSYNVLLDLDDEDEDENSVDELSDYLSQPRERQLQEDQLLVWWIGRKDRWPRLFCMAMDLLSIPSMSSENERAFSQAKLVVTSQRHRLHYTTLNKLVCLKAWNKDGTFLEGWGN